MPWRRHVPPPPDGPPSWREIATIIGRAGILAVLLIALAWGAAHYLVPLF